MCGLFGFIDFGGVLNCQQKKRIVYELSKESEARGTDAAGIAYLKQGRMSIYKRPSAAHKLHFHIPKESRVVMGHTRLTTQGNQSCNYNNHPFLGRLPSSCFALAHNGVLYNDVQLKKAEHLPKTRIKTDSYIAVQLIEKDGAITMDSLAHMAEKLEGSFTFTVLEEDGGVYFIKGDNPLCIYQFNGFYLYASTEDILKKALRRFNMGKMPHKRLSLNCGEILKIDRFGNQLRGKFEMTHLDIWNYNRFCSCYNTRRTNPMRSAYQRELLEYAASCGVDRQDIELLLECGYDESIIEELLYDPLLFQSCMEELLFSCGY